MMWKKIRTPTRPSEPIVEPMAEIYRRADRNRQAQGLLGLGESARRAIIPAAVLLIIAVAILTAMCSSHGGGRAASGGDGAAIAGSLGSG